MKRVLAIAILGLKQIRRQKLFVGVVFFFILYLGFCLFLGQLSAGHVDKVLRDMGLAGIEISLIILSVFGLSFDLSRDRSTHTLDIYLLNLNRNTYLASKLLSYIFAAFLYLIISGIALSFLLFIYHSFNLAILAALYSLLLKASLVIGFTCLFGFIFSSPLLTMSASIFVYIAAELLPSAWEIISRSGSVWQKYIFTIMYVIFPNFLPLDFRYLAVWGKMPSCAQIIQVTVYSFAYLVCIYLLNTLIFGRKEL